MSSKRKRNDSNKADRPSKKVKISTSDRENRIEGLPNEIQVQILALVPSKQFAQLRLVSSQWRNLTTSNEYGMLLGKLLCISIFGENCVSVRRSQPAAATSNPNPHPQRYVVLKSVEGYNDWIGYYQLRTLFGKYKAQVMPSSKRDDSLSDTELSFNNIAEVLQAKQGSEYLVPMLLKLIPALLSSHSNGLLVAKKACSLLTETTFRNAVYFTRAQYVSGCLDYLPAYHEKILNLIKIPELQLINFEPEFWLAFYFDLGSFVSDEFEDTEAQNMIAAIDQGCYEGIAVRKELFLARSEHAAEFLSQTPYDTVKQVLRMFPPHILKPTACTAVSSVTPKLLPTTDQWDTYVQTQTAFFKSAPLRNGVRFDKDVTLVHPIAMKQDMQHIDFDIVVSTILNWLASKDYLDPALMQQALHVLNAYAMWGVIKSLVLKAITTLLIKLKPHLNDKQTMSYLMMIGTTLLQGSYPNEAMPNLENLVNHMLKLVPPMPVVSTELMIALLRLACSPRKI